MATLTRVCALAGRVASAKVSPTAMITRFIGHLRSRLFESAVPEGRRLANLQCGRGLRHVGRWELSGGVSLPAVTLYRPLVNRPRLCDLGWTWGSHQADRLSPPVASCHGLRRD